MKKACLYTMLFFAALLMTVFEMKCSAQRPHNTASLPQPKYPTDTIITNLEYVVVMDITGKHKLYHVQELIKRNGAFYYGNLFPVNLISYKQKDSVEVVVKP